VVINILCDTVIDIADVNVTTHPLTSHDGTLICALRVEITWGVLRMMKESSSRQWRRSTLNDLIEAIDKTSSADRKQGSVEPRPVRMSDNIAVVDKLIYSSARCQLITAG